LLITGGGSSVGYYATQIAKLRGARVIATASARRAELARQAGADFVIDYQHKDVTKVAKDLTRGIGVDGIIDMDLSSTVRLINEAVMAPHSTAVFYGSNVAADIGLNFPTMLWNSYGLKSFVVYELKPDDRKTGVTELNKLIAENALRHAVGERFSLRDIAKAHEAVEQGNGIGNVVIDVDVARRNQDFVRFRARPFSRIQRGRGANQRIERRFVNTFARPDVDGAAGVAVETGIEQFCRIIQRRAFGEGQLDLVLVGFAGADDAVHRPHRHAAPFHLLDRHPAAPDGSDLRIMRQRLAAPVAELCDPGVDHRPMRSSLFVVIASRSLAFTSFRQATGSPADP
jgi:hypothetical protein